ncbi:MAG: DUF4872 domain-containing protein, partial [Spirochaetales bacterium]|nr:DUF4872 domain-containing protein [Spirochaetales bacterium]
MYVTSTVKKSRVSSRGNNPSSYPFFMADFVVKHISTISSWYKPLGRGAKARSWTVKITNNRVSLKDSIPGAVKAVAFEFLHPLIKNFGYLGIEKLSKELVSWMDMAKNPETDLVQSAEVMEKGGTGGALFRAWNLPGISPYLKYRTKFIIAYSVSLPNNYSS